VSLHTQIPFKIIPAPSEKRSVWVAGALRAFPFLLGAAIAGALFGVFGWDLAHHWDPASRNRSHPWVGLLVVLIWMAPLAPVGIRWLQRRRSQSWPWAETTIEGGSVALVPQGRGRVYRLTVIYSYSVGSEEYGGIYTESCGSESEAQGLLKSLRGWPPPARYKASDPSNSVMDPYRDAALAVKSQEDARA
jgi:hypothetical protein